MIQLDANAITVDGITLHTATMQVDDQGFVLRGEGRFDPPTTPLDADGQGLPYASYAFAAQLALVEVDIELGTVRCLRIVAAHDVGGQSTRSKWRDRSRAASLRASAWR